METKMQSKKGWLIRDFVLVGIVFGLIITLYVFAVAGIADNYNNSNMVNPTFSANYNKLQNNLNELDTSFKAVKGGNGLNLIGTFNIAFNSVFTVISMVWNGLLVYTGMAGSLVSDFTFLDANVVGKFLAGLIAMLTVTLIFIWLSSVTRGKI
jgi:hypothetical protein